MKVIQSPCRWLCFVLVLTLTAGCAGTKLLRKPEPLMAVERLATASDHRLSATVDWVIFRGGPGSWAKNVDWDEYLLQVENLADESIEITSVTVVDSLGTRVEPRFSRSKLVSGTKETKRRYKGKGIKVKAGLNGGLLVGAGVAAAAGTSGIGAAAMAGGGAAAGAAAVVVAVPVLAVAGVLRGVNNSKVNQQIENRQTRLPIALDIQQAQKLRVFFPLAPSPQQVELRYLDAGGPHLLTIDTQIALQGLHVGRGMHRLDE